MSTTIVLIRHGKAELPQEGLRDDMRTLTSAGRRSLTQCLPTALAPLAPELEGKTLAILTSPFVRARQTAKIVIETLGVEASAETSDTLASDDAKAIVAEARDRSEDVVVMVGHVPTLERASQLLCGTRLTMKPGAVACFALVDEFNGADNLRWFAQGPLVERWERSLDIEEEATRLGKELGRGYRAFVDDPSDTSALERLHGAIGSLGELLATTGPLLKRKASRKTLEDLNLLQELTAPLHDLDAHVGEDPATSLQNQADRVKQADRLLSGLASRKAQRALDNVRSFAKHLPWRSSIAEAGISSADLTPAEDTQPEEEA